MLIRFGYVAMSVKLENCSPSKTISVKNLERLPEGAVRFNRLKKIAAENLANTMRLIYHNLAHQIRVFRFTSKLIPIATHPLAEGWDFTSELKEELARIGVLVKDHQMRISTHPDHFTLLNSPRPEVTAASRKDLEYHEKIFQAMDLPEAEMIMHVGGVYAARQEALERFKANWLTLPETVRGRIRLENDDKVYGALDVVELCEELQIPMVLDIHHFNCLNTGEQLEKIIPRVFATWGERIPKFHFSTPKSQSNCRAHADDIDLFSFQRFLFVIREFGRDLDIMLEAKNKDGALFKLMDGMKGTKGVTIVDEASIII